MATQLHVAEAVLPGHPDKICDAIADALVEEATQRQARAVVGVEVAIHRATVFLSGHMGCTDAASIDIPEVVRRVFTDLGHGPTWGPAPEELRIEQDLVLAELPPGEEEYRSISDDQSIVIGYAIDRPGTNYIPAEQMLAHRIMRSLDRLRGESPELQLGPDGKLIVLVEEVEGVPTRLAGFSASLQQSPSGSAIDLHRAVRGVLGEQLMEFSRAVPGFDVTVPEAIALNGVGDFSTGGPEADNGLSGKKLVIDFYGPRVPIGGGALSGKDFYKADRAGALIARRLAKAVVLTGVSHECQATLSFVPGQGEGQIVRLLGDGKLLDASRWARLLDRSLAGVGARYTGAVPMVELARVGHFTQPHWPWERVHLDPEFHIND